MYKKITRIISAVLVIALLMCIMPSEAVAYAVGESFNEAIYDPETESPVSSESTIEEAEIVTEIQEGRGEFQKEYLLDNGQRLIVMYPTAVHYEKDGQWEEIDNTLKASANTGRSVYRNTEGMWNVILPASLNTNEAVEVQHDGYSLKFRFAGKLLSRPGEEIMSSEETAEAEIASEEAVMQQEINAEAAASAIEDTAETSSEEMVIQQEINAETAASAIEDATVTEENLVRVNGTVYESAAVSASVGVVQEQVSAFAEGNNIQRETAMAKANAAIEYSSVYQNVDLRYDLNSNKLKESVIINNMESNLRGYRYILETDLILEKQEDNSIYAYQVGATEGADPVFFMPAPYLMDNMYAFNGDIDVILESVTGGYSLTYILPREWMTASEREYPVILDPVIQPELSTANIQDQTVFERKTAP